MKITYLSNSQLPSKNANSVHVMKMSQALAKNGHEVELYGIKMDTENSIFNFYGVEEKFNIIRLARPNIKFFGSILYALKVKKNIEKTNSSNLLYGRDVYSLSLMSNLGVPFVYEVHSIPPSFIHWKMEERLFLSENFKRLVVISEALKNEYLSRFEILKNKEIVIAHDGADLPKNNNENIDSLTKKNKITVGNVGHLYTGRGIDIIIELAKRMQHITFNIIGGNEEDVDYWKEKCFDLNNITFHGFVPNGEIEHYYVKNDILIAPYQNKVQVAGNKGDTSKWMSPMKIFEYMSYKKPIISSNLPVLREVLIHNENCLLCETKNIMEWENAINLLASNPQLRIKLSNNAYNTLIHQYTWKMRAERVLGNVNEEYVTT